MKRVYICHTYYHVYVALLKECRKKEPGEALFLLSSYSNDFGDLAERLAASPLAGDAMNFAEHGEEYFPELKKYHQNRGAVRNLFQRMKYFRLQARLLKPYVPVELRDFEDIWVFCDSDPIGYYLNAERIPYHAAEDGLDCLKYYDTARYDNRGLFPLKAFLARHNLIFIQNGFSKYCLDMEVNSLEALMFPVPKGKEENRQALADALSAEESSELVRIFLPGAEALLKELSALPEDRETLLVLTEPLCDLATREQIFKDIIRDYGSGRTVILKPHPRDELDYASLFPEHIVLKGRFPMEVLNHLPVSFDRVVSVFTVPDAIRFAGKKIFLGEDFMDRYEPPEVHRQNEAIKG